MVRIGIWRPILFPYETKTKIMLRFNLDDPKLDIYNSKNIRLYWLSFIKTRSTFNRNTFLLKLCIYDFIQKGDNCSFRRLMSHEMFSMSQKRFDVQIWNCQQVLSILVESIVFKLRCKSQYVPQKISN